jgi:hypothetical protein
MQTTWNMLAELREDNKMLAARLREAHGVCDEHRDVATASLIETWIDETERRTWFLFEAGRSGEPERLFKKALGPSSKSTKAVPRHRTEVLIADIAPANDRRLIVRDKGLVVHPSVRSKARSGSRSPECVSRTG